MEEAILHQMRGLECRLLAEAAQKKRTRRACRRRVERDSLAWATAATMEFQSSRVPESQPNSADRGVDMFLAAENLGCCRRAHTDADSQAPSRAFSGVFSLPDQTPPATLRPDEFSHGE